MLPVLPVCYTGAGPHRLHPNAAAALATPPRRELTLTLSRGFTWPRLSVAAGAPILPVFPALAAGPHPRRELTLTPRLGFTCPRLGVAAGAPPARGGLT